MGIADLACDYIGICRYVDTKNAPVVSQTDKTTTRQVTPAQLKAMGTPTCNIDFSEAGRITLETPNVNPNNSSLLRIERKPTKWDKDESKNHSSAEFVGGLQYCGSKDGLIRYAKVERDLRKDKDYTEDIISTTLGGITPPDEITWESTIREETTYKLGEKQSSPSLSKKYIYCYPFGECYDVTEKTFNKNAKKVPHYDDKGELKME